MEEKNSINSVFYKSKTTANELPTWAKYTAFAGFGIAAISFAVVISGMFKVRTEYAVANQKLQELFVRVEELKESQRSKRAAEIQNQRRSVTNTPNTTEDEKSYSEQMKTLEALEQEYNRTRNMSEEQSKQITQLKNDPGMEMVKNLSSNAADIKKQVNESEEIGLMQEEKINKLNESIIKLDEINRQVHEDIYLQIHNLEREINNSKTLRAEQVTKIDSIKKSMDEIQYIYDEFQPRVTESNSLITASHSYNLEQNDPISALNNPLVEINELNVLTKSRKDCEDVAKQGFTLSMIYEIMVNGKRTRVFCDLFTNGGNWTVVQRRVSDEVDFYRDWKSYQDGFGNLDDSFWLGLDTINFITSSGTYQLRVDLKDFSDNSAYALYSSFSIGDHSTKYKLNLNGYTGNAGDSLSSNNNRFFTTSDQDNDQYNTNCAVRHHGAWWYNQCIHTNLNGQYFTTETNDEKSINWFDWKGDLSLKQVKMSIKPV